MKHLTLAFAAAVTMMTGASLAQAQDLAPKAGDFVVRGGVAVVRFDSSGSFVVAGQPLAGAGLKLTNRTTGSIEGDYFVRPDISLSLTLGIPPTVSADGEGALAPLGKLGSARLGVGVAQANYHFVNLGAFQPWVGAGVSRLVVFNNHDGAVQNLDVKDHWGTSLQAGADYMLSPKVGVHASVAKIFLKTEGSADLGPAPVSAKIDLNPLIYQAGLAYRF
jgi:outer membrane protein